MATQVIEQRTYGNFVQPRTPGIWRLGLIGTGAVFGIGILAMIVQAFAGLIAGLVIVVAGVIAIAPLAISTRDGRNGWTAVLVRVSHRRATKAGTTIHAPDMLDSVAFGAPASLPGLLARSELITVHDSLGHPFGVVEQGGAVKHFSAVIAADADGAQLVDQSDIDVWVARWGNFLAELGDEPGLVGCSVTVETAPDPGHTVTAEVQRLLTDDAPALSRAVMTETAARYPAGSAKVTSWLAITWTPTRAGSRKVGKAELLAHIGTRMPGLVSSLIGTGVGAAHAMSPTEIAERVQIAYDPAASTIFDEVRAAGEEADIPWADVAAPSVDEYGRLMHADAVSVTWRMIEPPRSAVQSTVLVPLLKPHADLLRKRVTLLYRPHRSDEAARVADEDLRTAAGHAASRKGEQRASDSRALAAARQTASEQASGAGLIRFAILVTATTTPENQHKGEAVVSQLSGTSRLKMKPATGSQAVAFQAALGVGLVLSSHTRIPSIIREQL